MDKMIKTKKEIELLKKSAKISNSCIPIIKRSLAEDRITEKELARRIRKKMKQQRAGEAFRMIVCSGKRAARVHAKPRTTNKTINGLGYVDFGANYKGYKTDITVPFIKGKISKKERRMVKAVLQAYKLAVCSIKIGEPCWKVHEKTNNFLKKWGYECPHAIGHGIGKKTHEIPYIGVPKKKRLAKKKRRKWERIKKITFQPGMVFTIEPAVYVKGLSGFRIENDILLTKRGVKVLTNARLIEI